MEASTTTTALPSETNSVTVAKTLESLVIPMWVAGAGIAALVLIALMVFIFYVRNQKKRSKPVPDAHGIYKTDMKEVADDMSIPSSVIIAIPPPPVQEPPVA